MDNFFLKMHHIWRMNFNKKIEQNFLFKIVNTNVSNLMYFQGKWLIFLPKHVNRSKGVNNNVRYQKAVLTAT